MTTITVALDKQLGYISNDIFDLLSELFKKTNPAVLNASKEDAIKIIAGESPSLTSGALILSRSNDIVVSTYQAVAEREYYAKKYRLTGMIEQNIKSSENILRIENALRA